MTTLNAYARIEERLVHRKGDHPQSLRVRPKMLRLFLTALLAAIAVACLSACGGGGTSIVVGIIPSNSQMMDQGSSLSFQATTANDVTNKGVGGGVTWTVTGTGCAGTGCGTLTNVQPNSVTFTAPTGNTASITVTLKATSNTASKATATVSISVVLPPQFTLPQVLPGGTNGINYSQQIQVTGGVAPLIFSLPPGSSLPGGLTLNQSGLISGRPTGPAPPNPAVFNVQVTDSANPPAVVISPQFSIAINPAPPLVVTQTSPLPPATLNKLYRFTLATSGGTRPFHWTVLSGCLPTGLQLGLTSGRVTGTPTSTAPCSGMASQFTPQVTDSSIPPQIQSSATPLTLAVNTAPTLSVLGGSLPPGSVASPYSASIGITGGLPPYQNIVVTNGQLPSGLSLNPTTGVITGIPVLIGTSTFSVQVGDSATPPDVASSPANNPLQISIGQPTTDPNSLLSGTYVFLFNGYDDQGAVAIAGSFSANGAGKITGGLEDVNRASAITLGATLVGTYSITPDGRGIMQINALDSVGRPFNSGYRFVLDSGGNARMFEDNTVLTVQPPVATHGAGQIKLQQGSGFGAASLGGNYAFAFTGPDANSKPAAFVGTVHSDQSSTLGPGMADFNDAGTYNPALPVSGSYSVASATGRGVASFVFQPVKQPQVTLQYSFYFVSNTDLFFLEIDTPGPLNESPPRLSGEMIQQQPGVAFDSTALSGPGVVSGSGTSTNASVFVGLLSPCNAGGVCLTYTENNGGTISNPVAPFNNGSFIITNNGRVDFTSANGTPTLGPRVAAAYLTGMSQGFIIGSDTAVTVGLLEQQSGGNPNFSAASVLGGYTLGAPVTADNMVKNVAGQVTADGVSTISGTVDEADPSGTVNIGSALAAGFAIVNAATGQGTFTTTAPPGIPANMVFYIVSPASLRAVSIDSIDTHPEVLFFDH